MSSIHPGSEGRPLPSWVLPVLACGLAVFGLTAAGLAFGMSSLRQGRLLDAATEIAHERTVQAGERLSRAGDATATLDARRREAEESSDLLFQAGDEGPVRADLEVLVETSGLLLMDVRFGTFRGGEVLGAVSGSLEARGNREDLPVLLAGFYDRPRVVRLTSLELRDDEDGDLIARLRWDYAAPVADPPPNRDASDLAPPRIAARGSLLAVDAWNRGRWERLDAAASELRSLQPALADLAAIDAEIDHLDRRRRTIARWKAASQSEARSVQRKLPAALRMLDVSAVGRAVLRPGPGGALKVDEAP